MMNLFNKYTIDDYKKDIDKHFYKIDGVWLWPLQNTNIFPLFTKLFNSNSFTRIVEIGTSFGGLTLLLRKIGFNGELITYNINDVIMVHDYCDNLDKFNSYIKDNFWGFAT